RRARGGIRCRRWGLLSLRQNGTAIGGCPAAEEKLTLNAVGGIGMLAVGILSAPFIGYLQETSATRQLEAMNPALYQTVTVEKSYLPGKCQAIDPVKS